MWTQTIRRFHTVALGPLTVACLLFGSDRAIAQFYIAPAMPSVRKQGATKNVVVELYRVKKNLHLKITALEGVEFAVAEASSPGPGLAWKDPAGKVYRFFLPEFSRGDRNITIKIDPAVGFTELAGLKFLDPVVVHVASDGALEADRAGVRAIAFQGTGRYSDCFLAAAQTTDEQGNESFAIGGFSQAPMADDGSMTRTPGEILDCQLRLSGQDGAEHVSKQVKVGDRLRMLFVPIVSPK